MKSLEYLAKEDPHNYFAEPVDVSMVPGYRDVVRCRYGWLDWRCSACLPEPFFSLRHDGTCLPAVESSALHLADVHLAE